MSGVFHHRHQIAFQQFQFYKEINEGEVVINDAVDEEG